MNPTLVQISGINAEFVIDRYDAKVANHGSGDAGIDLIPLVDDLHPINRQYHNHCELWTVHLGCSILVPEGCFGLLTNRSSSLYKLTGCQIYDAKIDHGYTGELFAQIVVPVVMGGDQVPKDDLTNKLICFSSERVSICQIIIIPFVEPRLSFRDKLPPTDRGAAGFGSTDKISTHE